MVHAASVRQEPLPCRYASMPSNLCYSLWPLHCRVGNKMTHTRRNSGPHRQRPATQKDVAERAGVSLSTVSYVLNNGPRPISEETRQRVLEAISELGYHPNKYAQRLS